MNRKTNKTAVVISIIIFLAGAAFLGYGLFERIMLRQAAEEALESIRQGTDDETLDEIINYLISQTAGDGFLGSTVDFLVNGDDINDIYHALMRRMVYKVTAVQKEGKGKYRIGIRVGNINNYLVLQKTLELFKSRYEGGWLQKIEQGLSDLSADKSELFYELFVEASTDLENLSGEDVFLTRDYVADVDVNGELAFENENGEIGFIAACAGFAMEEGNIPEIKDEIKLYMILSVCLFLGEIIVLVIFRRKRSGDTLSDPASENRQEASTAPTPVNTAPVAASTDTMPASMASEAASTPPEAGRLASSHEVTMMYAMTPQHNNIPFAVHDKPVLIGRDSSCCKVIFPEGTVGVSRRHCSLQYDSLKKQFILTDLGSSYGTFLKNGEKLTPNNPYHLNSGDSFYAGVPSNAFKVEIVSST